MQLNFSSFKKTFLLFLPFMLAPAARKRGFAAVGIILVDILAASLLPYCTKRVVDGLSGVSAAHTSLAIILSFTILLGLFWTIEKVSSHIQEIVFFPVVNNAIRDLTSRVVQHVHTIPMQAYQELSCPEILSSLKRISQSARAFIKIFFLMIIPTIIKLIVTIFICVKIGFFGLALLPGLILSCWVLYKGTVRYVETRDRTWEITDAVIMRVNDSIANTKLARFFFDVELQSVNGLLQKEAILWNKTNTRLHSIHLAVGLILGFTITTILYHATQAVLHQTLTVGDFVMLKAQLIAAFLPFKNLSLEFRQLAESVVDIGKIRRVLEIPILQNIQPIQRIQTEQTEQKKMRKMPALAHKMYNMKAISLKKVSFGYQKNNRTLPILSELSFKAIEGDRIAILGNNGSGKSSLMGLMSGLFEPDQGEVQIHGRNPESYSPQEFRQILHYIPQDLRLFNQTLRENLVYGCQPVRQEKLLDIIDICGLNALVTNAVRGLESKVGDMGIRLSGGEKQRLALARAMLLKPNILLLDETLDALNIENEVSMLKMLFESIPTIVMVSHHPYALQLMDKIFTLKSGRLHSSHVLNEVHSEKELINA